MGSSGRSSGGGGAGAGRLVGCLVVCALVLPYIWFAGQTQQATEYSEFPLSPVPSPTTSSVPTPYRLLNSSQSVDVELLGDDRVSLMDLHDFRWLLDGNPPAGCSGSRTGSADSEAPFLLVVVHTAPGNTAKRRFIRETWGSPREGLLVRFMLGLPGGGGAHDADLQREIDAEQETHRDLVQGNFQDTYRNLTYKHTMAMKWVAYHCPAATYVLKMDDDVLVNTPVLMEFLRQELSPHGARDLLLCTPLVGALPKRSYRSKWKVLYAEFPAREYPTYCPGWAVMYSPDVAVRLYREAQHTSYFWVDDVLMTGILAKQLGLKHASWEAYVLSEGNMQRILDGGEPNFIFGPCHLAEKDNWRLWRQIQNHSR